MANHRLEDARAENRELRRQLDLLTEAWRDIPTLYLEALCELRRECTTPSRVGEQLGVAVSGTTQRQHGPRTNHAAQAAIRRERRELTERANRILGTERGTTGTLDAIIYGKDKRWRPTSASTTTQAGAG